MKNKAALTKPETPGAIQIVELLQRRWLSKNAFEIELTRPPGLEFKAGQTICFSHESRYFSCLSQAANTEASLPNLFCGEISECIRKNLRPGSYDFYLCGEREMLREVTLLVDKIYPESRLYTEVFF